MNGTGGCGEAHARQIHEDHPQLEPATPRPPQNLVVTEQMRKEIRFHWHGKKGTPILEALGDATLLALQGDGLDAGDAAEGW